MEINTCLICGKDYVGKKCNGCAENKCKPWYKGYHTSKGEKTIFGHDEQGNDGIPILIADKDTLDEDIEHIVKCVNNFDELVDALDNAIYILEQSNISGLAIDRIKKTLSNAQKEVKKS